MLFSKTKKQQQQQTNTCKEGPLEGKCRKEIVGLSGRLHWTAKSTVCGGDTTLLVPIPWGGSKSWAGRRSFDHCPDPRPPIPARPGRPLVRVGLRPGPARVIDSNTWGLLSAIIFEQGQYDSNHYIRLNLGLQCSISQLSGPSEALSFTHWPSRTRLLYIRTGAYHRGRSWASERAK